MPYVHMNATSALRRPLNGCPARVGEGPALFRHTSGPTPTAETTIYTTKPIVFDELEHHLGGPNL
eukprot:7382178-Prymnesium_polylepis.1